MSSEETHKPLDVDGVRSVTVGTVLWVIAFLVLLTMRGRLEDEGRSWWLWTCLAGAGLGLLGIEYTRRRRDAIARVRRYRAGGAPPTGSEQTGSEDQTSTAQPQNGRSDSVS